MLAIGTSTMLCNEAIAQFLVRADTWVHLRIAKLLARADTWVRPYVILTFEESICVKRPPAVGTAVG